MATGLLIGRYIWPFADAERAEDQIEDVVGGGGAGDFVERAERAVEVEQMHFVRGVALDRASGGG